MEINEISGQVIDAAMKVHTALGPGLLETAYEGCLMFELVSRGVPVARQVELPVIYWSSHRCGISNRLARC